MVPFTNGVLTPQPYRSRDSGYNAWMSPAERTMRLDAKANRERILAAAETVFGERGAAGSTEEVARMAQVGIATVFRHFPTKADLIEATLLRHFAMLTSRARALGDHADPAKALRTLLRLMIETGATKIALITLLGDGDAFPTSARTASLELRDAVAGVLRRAQSVGAVRRSIAVDEVYLLVRGLAQASATSRPTPATLRRAADIVFSGLTMPSRRD